MKIHSQRHPRWLSNTYLLVDEANSKACFIDAGGPTDELEKIIEKEKLDIETIFLTHHHHDHMQEAERLAKKYGADIAAHEGEKSFLSKLDHELKDREVVKVGELSVEALHIPGHTAGQLAFWVSKEIIFTGDTLFAGSIGGNMGPGHTSFDDLRHSIMDILMKLPKENIVYPGHMESTTVKKEWEENPFVRAFRELDSLEEKPCQIFGNEGTLLLRAPDYDGGTKCWVRLKDGVEAIAPGSGVQV